MKKYSIYPFYSSIRFRFGLLFNCLLLVFLSGIIFLLFNNVRNEFESSFRRRLWVGANLVLQKTDISPVTVPLPQAGEYFSIRYSNNVHTDTLFGNLPVPPLQNSHDSLYRTDKWWSIQVKKKLETGGVVTVVYMLPATDFNKSMRSISTLLFIYIPGSVVIAFIAGYFLSGVFLRPLRQMIDKANRVDLGSDIRLLDEPVVKDELHELTDAINRMLARIQKQSQQQNNFFASASHELRTPLSNMLTELQTADLKSIPAEMNMLMSNQLTEVKRLKELVNNFLWMSQLKADGETIHKTVFNLAEVCVELIESQQWQAGRKSQSFKIGFYPEDSDFLVLADKAQISIAFSNLVSNAIKYGLSNEVIDLTISKKECIMVSLKNKTLLVTEDANQLKNEFKRGDDYQEGFGLGLWLTDQLLEKNGGKLDLHCKDNIFVADIKFSKYPVV